MMRRTASGHSAAAASTVSGAVVPPQELSSAITFLGETALYQACDLLLAQSESLFGGNSTSTAAADETKDELKDGGDKITSSSNVAMSEDAPSESDAKQTQGQKKAGEPPSPSCVQRLTLLHGKCKNAQNIILRADEAGMINDAGLPSAPSLMPGGTTSGNNLACQPSPMPRIAPSGSMPPPPTSMHLNRNLSSSSSLTPGGGGGSLHRSRGSFSAGNNGGLLSNNPRVASNDTMNNSSNNNLALLRRKSGHTTTITAADHNHGTGTNKKFHRTTSDGGDAATAGSHHKHNTPKEKKQANPPPEVLNFLRQLNSQGSESQQQIGTLEGFDEVAGTSNSNTPKKRKANSPPIQLMKIKELEEQRKAIILERDEARKEQESEELVRYVGTLNICSVSWWLHFRFNRTCSHLCVIYIFIICSKRNLMKRKELKEQLKAASQPSSAAKRGKMDASEQAQAALSNNPKLKPSAPQKPSPPPPPNARPSITRTPSGKVKPPPPSKTPDPSAGRSARSTPSSADGAPSKTPEASTAATTSSGGRSTRSKRSTPSSASSTNKTSSGDRVYGIGESVYVKRDGKKYSGIVKNVDYGSDTDPNNDDEEDAGDDGGIMYEVEFSDGEIYDVNPNDMMENEDDF